MIDQPTIDRVLAMLDTVEAEHKAVSATTADPYPQARVRRQNIQTLHFHGTMTTGGGYTTGYAPPCRHRHTTEGAAWLCHDQEALDQRTLLALALFGEEYHSGQASRWYRLQARARALLERRYAWSAGQHPLQTKRGRAAIRRTTVYQTLVATYSKDRS